MKKSLISFGMLQAKYCMVILEQGSLKVVQGLGVTMKSVCESTLCYMKENTDTCMVATLEAS